MEHTPTLIAFNGIRTNITQDDELLYWKEKSEFYAKEQALAKAEGK